MSHWSYTCFYFNGLHWVTSRLGLYHIQITISNWAFDIYTYGLLPTQHQAIIWTNAGLLRYIGPLETIFSEIWINKTIFLQYNEFEYVICKMAAILSLPHCVFVFVFVFDELCLYLYLIRFLPGYLYLYLKLWKKMYLYLYLILDKTYLTPALLMIMIIVSN